MLLIRKNYCLWEYHKLHKMKKLQIRWILQGLDQITSKSLSNKLLNRNLSEVYIPLIVCIFLYIVFRFVIRFQISFIS